MSANDRTLLALSERALRPTDRALVLLSESPSGGLDVALVCRLCEADYLPLEDGSFLCRACNLRIPPGEVEAHVVAFDWVVASALLHRPAGLFDRIRRVLRMARLAWSP